MKWFGGRNSASRSETQNAEEQITHLRPPVRFQEGRLERHHADSSSLSRGLGGFAVWVRDQGIKDGAAGSPGDDWDQVVPPLIRQIHRTGQGEVEAPARMWARADSKLGAKVAESIRRRDHWEARKLRTEAELTSYQSSMGEFFSEARKSHTTDDDYRRFEGPFSAKTLGFWALLTMLALGELPLTYLAYKRVDPSWIVILPAFATGCALVGAGHFVGTKTRRLMLLRERQLDQFAELEKFNTLVDKHATLPIDYPADLRPPKPQYPDRLPPTIVAMQKRQLLVGLVTVLAVFACVALSILRTRQAGDQLTERATKNCVLAIEDSGVRLKPKQVPIDQLACASYKGTVRTAGSASFLIENSALFAVLQLLLFGVAATLTYHRHDEFVEAVRTLNGKIQFARWQRQLFHKKQSTWERKRDAAHAARMSEFLSRVSEAKERQQLFQSFIHQAYTEMNRNRQSGASFEIAGQRPPMVELPSWVLASYPVPGHSSEAFGGVLTVSLARLEPQGNSHSAMVEVSVEQLRDQEDGDGRSAVTPSVPPKPDGEDANAVSAMNGAARTDHVNGTSKAADEHRENGVLNPNTNVDITDETVNSGHASGSDASGSDASESDVDELGDVNV
jgi:hypothetical protein